MSMHELNDHELIEELKKRFEQNKKALQEVQKLNEQLKTVNKKLEDSEAMKGHFISNITNEIINPFSSILALSRNILSVKKENWKKVISMVALIYGEAFNLDFQLRNIFVAAKIEAGEIFPEVMNVDISHVVNSLIESFKYELKKKKITIKYEPDFSTDAPEKPYFFKTDPEKLRLILANLLSNAIKYSDNDTQVIVKGWEQDGHLNLSVQDFGTGISPENQKIIFDRFKRLDSGINSLHRGHGLGLSINKALLDALNGHIDIQSELGQGTLFTISLPPISADVKGLAFDGNELFFDDEFEEDSNSDVETF
ncbi:MAG: HAMP domain-containing sensor histidine kinase [Bacteroidales bacterium]|jgi:signal transduction histidine kinase